MKTGKKLLVVVDMQNDFIYGRLGSKEAQEIVPTVREKIRHWDGDIIFTMDTHTLPLKDTFENRVFRLHCIEGTEGWKLVYDIKEIYDEHPGQSIKVKEKYNRFGITRGSITRYIDYDYIEFVGTCTDICVISNALIARSENPHAEIHIDANCCAGTSPEMHEKALNVMSSCLIYVDR